MIFALATLGSRGDVEPVAAVIDALEREYRAALKRSDGLLRVFAD